MTPAPRRSAPAKAKSAIPQVSWRTPQPAPIVLVSGPEEVCAERATAGIRDFLRSEDPTLEVSDVRGKKLLDAIRAGQGSGIEIACPAIKRDSDRFDFAVSEFKVDPCMPADLPS